MIRSRREGRQNYHGDEVRGHGEKEARRMKMEWMEEWREHGLDSESLRKLPKSDQRKVEIAGRIRERTGVGLRMLADGLAMGTAINVSRLTRSEV